MDERGFFPLSAASAIHTHCVRAVMEKDEEEAGDSEPLIREKQKGKQQNWENLNRRVQELDEQPFAWNGEDTKGQRRLVCRFVRDADWRRVPTWQVEGDITGIFQTEQASCGIARAAKTASRFNTRNNVGSSKTVAAITIAHSHP